LRALVAQGVVGKRERVACIITGNVLKDPDIAVKYNSLTGKALSDATGLFAKRAPEFQNLPIEVDADLGKIVKILEGGVR